MNDRSHGGSLLTAAGFGAGLMYLFDPARGARRRARLRDQLTRATHKLSRAAETTRRDAVQRMHGTAATFRYAFRRERVTDAVLVERVRARMGRYVSHPHAIEVHASNGAVTLSGPVLAREASRLIRAARGVRGVLRVVDELKKYRRGVGVPALQGSHEPAGQTVDFLQIRWAPATRAMAAAAGAGLAYRAMSRADRQGAVLGLLGIGLLARATTNLPVRRLATVGSPRHAMNIQKTIAIDAPIGEVYAFWSLYERFPLFMSRVLEVTSSETSPMQSHWRVAGPAGVPVEFDVEITSVVPNRLIAWQTLEGSPVAHAGEVRFEPDGPRRSRAHIRMSYHPPAGWLGHGVAAAFGVDPKRSLDEDLVRMKSLIETGRAPRDAAQPGAANQH